VHTLSKTIECLGSFGHEVETITPDQFRTLACPTYPEIRLALLPRRAIARRLRAFLPHALHIATEGPLGIAASRVARALGLRFTTSYHTQFPQYLRARFPIPLGVTYGALRAFHNSAAHCMVSTPSLQRELAERGFRNLVRWRRGVDTELFRPRDKGFLALPRPIAAYLGRVAVEKNVEAFLRMSWPGTKLVIGDGPARARLQTMHPEAVFVGMRRGEDLAAHLAAADVMVFPSLTDTFGLVNLEAMACGVPVAAHPVTGPVDAVLDGVTGILDWDLETAARRALQLDPVACREYARTWTWAACSREFESHLVDSRANGALRPGAAARRMAAPVGAQQLRQTSTVE
jgi:glycosyltransferase involved in cell wall biosynthesis